MVKTIQCITRILAGATLIVSTTVFAAMPVMSGWYIEGDLGKSDANHKHYPGVVRDTGFGYNIDGGYKFNQWVAADVGFTGYNVTRIKTPTGTTVATDEHYSYDLAAKLILPIFHTGLELFGKGGVARINSYTELKNEPAAITYGYTFNTGTHSKTAPYYGVGAEYAIISKLIISAQWMRVQGSYATGDADLYSLGLSYFI